MDDFYIANLQVCFAFVFSVATK